MGKVAEGMLKVAEFFRKQNVSHSLSRMWSLCGELSISGHPSEARRIREIMAEICNKEASRDPKFNYKIS